MPKQENNPFDMSSFFSQFDPTEAIHQMQEGFQKLQLPNVDTSALVDAQRKNLEALVEANKSALEGTQKLIERQTEIFQQAMTEAGDAWQEVVQNGNLNDASEKQTELVRAAFDKAVVNSKEISDMIHKTQEQVTETINERISEGLHEIKDAMEAFKK